MFCANCQINFPSGGIALITAADYHRSVMTAVIGITTASVIGLFGTIGEHYGCVLFVGITKGLLAIGTMCSAHTIGWFLYELTVCYVAFHFSALLMKRRNRLEAAFAV